MLVILSYLFTYFISVLALVILVLHPTFIHLPGIPSCQGNISNLCIFLNNLIFLDFILFHFNIKNNLILVNNNTECISQLLSYMSIKNPQKQC